MPFPQQNTGNGAQLLEVLAKMFAPAQPSSTYVDKPYVAQQQAQRQQSEYEMMQKEDYYNRVRALNELRAQGSTPSAMWQKANNFVGDFVTGNTPQQMIENIALDALPIGKLLTAVAPIAKSSRKLKLFEKTSEEIGTLYHGGKNVIREHLNPNYFNKRDYGFYGKGFYVTQSPEYAKTYGGRLTDFTVHPDAKILESTLDPNKAPKELVDAVKNDFYSRGIDIARKNGKEQQFIDELNNITNSPIDWNRAVDMFAENNGYDIIKHSSGEIVVKNPAVLINKRVK